MKFKILVLTVFCLFQQMGKAQTLKNGNFETGDAAHWQFSNPATNNPSAQPGYTLTVSKDETRQNSLVLQFKSTGNSYWCQIKQKIAYQPTDTLEKLRISTDVKIKSSGNATAGLCARVYHGDKSYGLTDKYLINDQDWQRIAFDFIVPRMTDSIAAFCVMRGEGEVYFDNVSIEKLKVDKLEQSAEAHAYLDRAIDLIAKNAMNKEAVDFKSLVKDANLNAADAKVPADCYSAIRYVLDGLNDHHSFFQTPDEASILNSPEDTAMLLPSGKLINNTIGYLKIPGCMDINPLVGKIYAEKLKEIIKSVDNKHIIGWIVDDRDNTGGNCWPMLLGLGPILGDGIFDQEKKNGIVTYSAGYWNGVVRDKDSVLIKTDSPYKLYKPFPKVAVLMNRVTGSSGESVLLSFKFRPKAKLFGEPSYGLTTYNYNFTLTDGAMIFVCSGKQTDRLGNEYGEKIYPDVAIDDDESTSNDEVIEGAIKWLKAKK